MSFFIQACSISPWTQTREIDYLFAVSGLDSDRDVATFVYSVQEKRFVLPLSERDISDIREDNESIIVDDAIAVVGPDDYVKSYENSNDVKDLITLQVVKITQNTIANLSTHQDFSDANNSLDSIYPLLQNSAKVGEYRLASGDTVLISLWAYPDLIPNQSTRGGSNMQPQGFTIDARGNIYLPLIGQIKAASLTPYQLSKRLRSRFSKYLIQPDTTVKITRYRGKRFFVTGAVKNPGQKVIEGQALGLLDAISDAGGASEMTNFHDITLLRKGVTYNISIVQMTKAGINPNDLLIAPGDFIKVGSNSQRQVDVLGEVGLQSTLIIPEDGLSLATAIAQSKGVNPLTANTKHIYVVRRGVSPNNTTLFRIDLTKLENMALASQFAMRPKDILYVDSSGLAKWNRIISLILPSASAINAGKSIAN